VRLFIAVLFEEEVVDRLCALQRALKAEVHSGNYTARENLHLTLAFLGEQSEEKIPLIQDCMERTQGREMALTFGRVGHFAREGECLYFAALEEHPDLIGLQKHLVQNLRKAGFSIESRRFVPHITLARRVGRTANDAQLLPEPFTAKACGMSLMLSERIGGRLTYTELSYVSLGN